MALDQSQRAAWTGDLATHLCDTVSRLIRAVDNLMRRVEALEAAVGSARPAL